MSDEAWFAELVTRVSCVCSLLPPPWNRSCALPTHQKQSLLSVEKSCQLGQILGLGKRAFLKRGRSPLKWRCQLVGKRAHLCLKWELSITGMHPLLGWVCWRQKGVAFIFHLTFDSNLSLWIASHQTKWHAILPLFPSYCFSLCGDGEYCGIPR